MTNFHKAIKAASARGMQFHVFCDEQNYTGPGGSVWVGEHIYNSSWGSYSSAQAVAARKENGRVYSSDGKRIN